MELWTRTKTTDFQMNAPVEISPIQRPQNRGNLA